VSLTTRFQKHKNLLGKVYLAPGGKTISDE
jgi:hypothetical protein